MIWQQQLALLDLRVCIRESAKLGLKVLAGVGGVHLDKTCADFVFLVILP